MLMSIRPVQFIKGEIFHCFNRGVDKRIIFLDSKHYTYFLKLLTHLNTSDVLGELRLHINKKPINPPVTILSYCLLPNHYHLVLYCNEDKVLSKFMQRIGTAYTMYFNNRYDRSGALFQGKFKAKHIDSDQYLKQILAYVTHNYIVHDINDSSLFRNYLDVKNNLVGGLASNFLDFKKSQKEIVQIIKEIRSRRQDLQLE